MLLSTRTNFRDHFFVLLHLREVVLSGRRKRRKKRSKAPGIIFALLIITAAGIIGYVKRDSLIPFFENVMQRAEQIAAEEKISGTYIDPDLIPEYCGEPYGVINGNIPELEKQEGLTEFEKYGALDGLGRCSAAYACVSRYTMPYKERESIGAVKPTGWHLVKYEGIDGNYLFNRCHLIAYQLTGENANERNLITGTRYMNTEGMLPFEIRVADYVKKTGHHVLYKVVPVFKGNNLVADGVWMQALSVEDDEISFNVFCYNVQPGIEIDYRTGDSRRVQG